MRTTIGESLKLPPLLNGAPATGKFCHQNFVDYVNSLNVACKGYIFGIRAYQNLTITTVVWKYAAKHNLGTEFRMFVFRNAEHSLPLHIGCWLVGWAGRLMVVEFYGWGHAFDGCLFGLLVDCLVCWLFVWMDGAGPNWPLKCRQYQG